MSAAIFFFFRYWILVFTENNSIAICIAFHSPFQLLPPFMTHTHTHIIYRGTDISEIDPGWRRPVIKLVQDQSRSTIDQQTLIPYGVHFKRLTTCDFTSRSTEISTSSDYQKSLSHEASVGGSYGFFSFKASVSYKTFQQKQQSSRTTSFESRAECSELRATLEKYYNHEAEGMC